LWNDWKLAVSPGQPSLTQTPVANHHVAQCLPHKKSSETEGEHFSHGFLRLAVFVGADILTLPKNTNEAPANAIRAGGTKPTRPPARTPRAHFATFALFIL
jgi:hypothetical protein